MVETKYIAIILSLLIFSIIFSCQETQTFTRPKFAESKTYGQSIDDFKTYNASQIIYRTYIKKVKKTRTLTKKRKFSFIIAGAKKCGTSALREFLANHPQVLFTSLYLGEGHYFGTGSIVSWMFDLDRNISTPVMILAVLVVIQAAVCQKRTWNSSYTILNHLPTQTTIE